jgi:hypothetical protein
MAKQKYRPFRKLNSVEFCAADFYQPGSRGVHVNVNNPYGMQWMRPGWWILIFSPSQNFGL